MKTASRHVTNFEKANRAAARIIASNPERYPGAMQTWAAAVLTPDDAEAGPLFGQHAGRLKPAPEIDYDHPAARVRD